MQFVKTANFVGTMIGPDGHIHRWTAPRKIHSTYPDNQRFYQKPGRATVRPKDLCGVRCKLHWIHILT